MKRTKSLAERAASVSEFVSIDWRPAFSDAALVKVGDLIRLLLQDGWRLARTRGSHRQYVHPTKPGTVTVAGKVSLDVPHGTLSAILKQAGLQRRSRNNGDDPVHGGC